MLARAKRKRYTHKRKTIKFQGMPVVLPRAATKLTPALAHKLEVTWAADTARGTQQWNAGVAKGCRVIFFKASEPIMRCPGRKLSRHRKARRAWVKKQCRDKKELFVKC